METEKPTLRNPPQERMTLKEIETKLNEAQLGLGFKPPCKNPGDPCVQKYHGKMRGGRTVFWYGSDCRLPAQKFCDACLAYWHVAVARNLVLHAIKMEEIFEETQKRAGHRNAAGEWIPEAK